MSPRSFTGVIEYAQAIDEVLPLATTAIRVFDRDLRDGAWNGSQRFALLKTFLLAGHGRRVYIVLHGVDFLTRECPRVLTLMRQHSDAVFIHQTNSEAGGIYDPMIIADDAHYVHRFHFEQPRGERVLNDPGLTQALLRRYEEIWHASTPAVTATVLGL